ncbi:MAG: ABC transporter ATP-binding protein [Alphaproteobacteria bacterium]|jgi:branched-chain amino acid transport system ATP-binding protein|nr:ABC transporter ATP-binding protein [Alphaproteobacteria bacterium]MBT4964700.1 ABC transporter ATP-binding protein [Alphaproteobacteria bacterium]MBT5161151.1 ABC transporter ATP-binding protein [Alphaproteobacteria bacterium]MBT7746638.1 ABC transporter ATP-binding protein [Alphaproteobacteria bacterium]
MDSNFLDLTNLAAGYGATIVLEDISFTLPKGESVSIIGRNGVGKSSLLNTIMGHTDLHSGSINFNARDISKELIHRRAHAGIGYVPQEREIFPSLTVEENLLVAASSGDWSVEKIYELFPHLAARRQNRGNQLSGGEQQMLAIGRALMGNPSLLMMDEPSEGLAPVIVDALEQSIADLRDKANLTIILVEQNIRLALSFSKRCIVMDRGQIVFDGDSTVLKDEKVLHAHMGLAA